MGGKTKITSNYTNFPYKQITNIDVEKEGIQWFPDNKPPVLKDGTYVVNHNSEHWMTCIVQFPEIYWIGSYGAETKFKDKPSKQFINAVKQQGFKTIYASDNDMQPPDSWLCGHFSIYFAKLFKKYVGQLTWDKFNEILKKEFTQKPSDYNVDKLTSWSKKESIM